MNSNFDVKIRNDMYKIQKATLWKRFASGLLDFILIMIIASGIMVVISTITNYDEKNNELQAYYQEYADKYGIKLDITQEEYEKLTIEEQEKYQQASEELAKDERVLGVYNLIINLMLLMTSIGILVGVIIVEFVVPIILKNGQTLGKKCFGICLVKNNSVKVNNICLFVRSLLGIYTVEIMIPLYVLILLIFGSGNLIFLILGVGIIIFDLILVLVTPEHKAIHDAFAYTVVVDKSIQMIFENEEQLIEFKKELHNQEVEKKKYY